MIRREDMDEIDLSGTKVPKKSATVKVTGDKRLQNGLIDLLSGGMWPIAFIILNILNGVHVIKKKETHSTHFFSTGRVLILVLGSRPR